MQLSNLTKIIEKSAKKRVGRGFGSGKGGHTTGRGTKGQKSRKGRKMPLGFEGGQVPLFKRLPQFGGFKNPASKNTITVSLRDFNSFKSGTVVTPEILNKKGIITKSSDAKVKVLANGKIEKKIAFKGFLVSEAARKMIEAAGGSVK